MSHRHKEPLRSSIRLPQRRCGRSAHACVDFKVTHIRVSAGGGRADETDRRKVTRYDLPRADLFRPIRILGSPEGDPLPSPNSSAHSSASTAAANADSS